jgi:enoyl-CoA hydratase/carnithine racemase
MSSYPNLTIDCQDSNVYIITMRKLPENRLNVKFAQEIIRALRDIETRLGTDAEGAVIIRGSDAKFFCTVGLTPDLRPLSNPFLILGVGP